LTVLIVGLHTSAGKDAPAAKASPATKPAARPPAISWGSYQQNLTPRSVTVLWTASEPTEGLLEYGLIEKKLDRRTVSPLTKDHNVTVTNLEPGISPSRFSATRTLTKSPGT